MSFMPPTLAEVADGIAIGRLTSAFHDAVNRRDQALFSRLWTDDAVLEIVGYDARFEGAAAIAGGFAYLLSLYEFLVQIHAPGSVEINGDRASGRIYGAEVARFAADGAPLMAMGLYDDEYLRGSDGWRMARRTFHFLLRNQSTPVVGDAPALPATVSGSVRRAPS